MALWDDILLKYIRDTPGIEQKMNKHRLTTNLSHGGLGLRQLWWSYITRWVTLGQQELRNDGPTQQLTATQYKYIDAVRALGGTVGQRISQPRQHWPLSAGLYDSKSSEEEGQYGRCVLVYFPQHPYDVFRCPCLLDDPSQHWSRD